MGQWLDDVRRYGASPEPREPTEMEKRVLAKADAPSPAGGPPVRDGQGADG